ncbi:MAG: 30S ribosome-binding factor RbfA [Flavobacteriales bacterium]|jgi:ribosome-binding factor A|nr:30S ribosome-binding factor RbfA [Flavobacteriales bacterium]
MSVRQEKIASVIKKELGKYLQQNAIVVAKGAMVTVTVVRMSPDLSIAKVYISIFGGKNNNESFDNIVNQSKLIRHEISKIVRNQLRKMPELHFYRDDSFDYAQEIDKLLQ